MRLEKLRSNTWKKVAIGGVCGIAVLSVGILATSRAKYRTTQSFNLVNGKITYKEPDFNLEAMYTIDEEGNEIPIDAVPGSNYELDDEKTKCTINNEDIGATIEYKDNKLYFGDITQKGVKCSIYFKLTKKTPDQVLGSLGIDKSTTKSSTGSFSSTATTNEGVFSIDDGDGTSYYWRGDVTNNYVKFAGYCWRIIRINGNGSIRMIYDGNTCHANGYSTVDNLINAKVAYNSYCNDSAYVGYMYGSTQASNYASAHANITSSNIKTVLDDWYKTNIDEKNYASYIDEEAGFCNDRRVATSSETWASGDTKLGYGNNMTYYAPFGRLHPSQAMPTLECSQSNDLFTTKNSNKGNNALKYPIGLITADEVVFAGGLSNTINKKYYLYNGQNYWTMSPYFNYYVQTWVFYVLDDGKITANNSVNGRNNTGGTGVIPGARPVINLKSTTTFSAASPDDKGTQNNPYVVQ